MSRIINRIDFSVLRNYPKWYIGFSDITVLHMWLNEVCGIISVHGEMPLNFNNQEKSGNLYHFKTHFLEISAIEWKGNFYQPGM